MEKRYLYKAKRKDNGEWVEGYYLNVAKINAFICTGKIKLDGALKGILAPEMYEVDPSTICQCTGLTDKNGKLIWENDILRYSYDYPDSPWLKAEGKTNDDIVHRTGHVFWQEWRGCWAVSSKVGKTGTNADVFTYCRNPNRTEVIGNVFDNPELLEGKV